MKRIAIISVAMAVSAMFHAKAQIYTMKDATVGFFSDAPMEDIKATNEAGQGVINFDDKTFSIRIPIKSFRFESELMQEHFNENYMESEKYPYATFKGTIDGPLDISKEGDYQVSATGVLTIHGVDTRRTIAASIRVREGSIGLDSQFMVRLADHDIEIPTIVFQKIAEEVEVTLTSAIVPYKR